MNVNQGRTINQEIGRRLQALRKAQGKTQWDVAKAVGVVQSTYGSYETGRNGMSPEMCVKLAEYFGVSCDCILRG